MFPTLPSYVIHFFGQLGSLKVSVQITRQTMSISIIVLL